METKVTVKTVETNKTPKMIAMLGALVAIVAAFLTWGITSLATVKGTDGDGTITAVLGGLAILFLWIQKIPAWLSALFGLAIAAVGVIDFTNMKDAVALDPQNGSVGLGLYLTIAGGLVLLAGAAWQFSQNRK